MLLFQQNVLPKRLEHPELVKKVLIASGIGHLLLLVAALFVKEPIAHTTIMVSLEDESYVVILPLYKKIAQEKVAPKAPARPAREYHAATAYVPKGKGGKTEKVVTEPEPFMKAQPRKPLHPSTPLRMSGDGLADKKNQKDRKKLADAPMLSQSTLSPVEGKHETGTPQPLYIGREDAQELREAQLIRAAIKKYWHAPQGLGTQVHCKVLVELDKKGNKKITFVESSQVPIFDTAVKAALTQAEFPEEKWNSTLTLLFE